MITVLVGDNSFEIRRELKKRQEIFLKQFSEFGLAKFDAEEHEVDELTNAVVSLPFLIEKRLVVIKNIDKNNDFMTVLPNLLVRIPEENDLLLTALSLSSHKNLKKLFSKSAELIEFKKISPIDLAGWVTEETKRLGGGIDRSTAQYLISQLSENQDQLSSEISKLILYSPKINRQSIELMIEPTPQSSTFQLLDAAFSGDLKRANKLYSDQRSQNIEPLAIAGLIVWQLNLIALAKISQKKPLDIVAREAGVSPFALKKSSKIAANMPLSSLRRAIKRLIGIELAIKTSSVNSDELLKNYLLILA